MPKLTKTMLTKLEKSAKNARLTAVQMVDNSGVRAHFGGGFSAIDITTVLYSEIMNYDFKNTRMENRDIFILSKGHGVLCYYPVLAQVGIINKDFLLETFNKNGSDLMTHPVMNLDLGIESSNGSLGQGLSMAVGLALAAKSKGLSRKHYVLVGNGECNEGSVWEAAMSAAHFNLDNIVVIVDNNNFQSDGKSEDVLNIGNIQQKWDSFNWQTEIIDGHDFQQIYQAFTKINDSNKPKAIIANTIKGKGLPFAENDNSWHHNRMTKSQLEEALSFLKN